MFIKRAAFISALGFMLSVVAILYFGFTDKDAYYIYTLAPLAVFGLSYAIFVPLWEYKKDQEDSEAFQRIIKSVYENTLRQGDVSV